MTFSSTAYSQSPVTPAIVLRIACYWLADSTPPFAFSTDTELTSQICSQLQTTYDIHCSRLQSNAGNAGHCIAHCVHAANCMYFNSRIFYAFLARRHSFILIFKGPMTFSATACSQSPVTPAIVLRIARYWLADSTPPLAFSTRYRTDASNLLSTSEDLRHSLQTLSINRR